ncbi:hypothetical protein BH11CYA1_BH11CYA1_40000 [soil metagenome]
MTMTSARPRKSHAQSIIELCCGIMVLVPIVLVLFDLTVIVLAVQLNDSTCREAARVGSLGSPDATACQNRVLAVINRANKSGSSMLSNFKLVSCANSVTAADLAKLSTYGGPVNGTVSVITEVDVRPFVVHLIYAGGPALKFKSAQSYPFTFVVPNTAN